MNEIKKFIVYFLFLLTASLLAYHALEPDKPKNSQIFDTTNLTTEQKQEFSDNIKTGNAYEYYGDHKKAVEEFEQAEQLNPKDRQTLYHLASAQHNAGQYEEAEASLKKLENSESNSADYWSFRAANISKKPDSLKNIKLAVKYVEKAYNLSKHKDSWLFLETRAQIYFEEYKYYRLKRPDKNTKTADEIKAGGKFLKALKDLKNLAEAKNDSFIRQHHDDLYNQYLYFPSGKYKSIYEELPQLDKIEYSQADIERIKNHRPQDSYPRKK